MVIDESAARLSLIPPRNGSYAVKPYHRLVCRGNMGLMRAVFLASACAVSRPVPTEIIGAGGESRPTGQALRGPRCGRGAQMADAAHSVAHMTRHFMAGLGRAGLWLGKAVSTSMACLGASPPTIRRDANYPQAAGPVAARKTATFIAPRAVVFITLVCTQRGV